MKATRLYAALLSALIFLSALGCQRQSEPQPKPDEQPSFKFEILDKDKTSVSFRVTPLAKSYPYVLMIIDKETFDSFDSVEAYIADDLA